jgi:undecaprenyl-diphosphatase
LDLIHLILLGLIQGVTEFLPISSSAHLLIPGIIFGWPDQGLEYDIAVHFGTLLAVLTYFRQDLRYSLSRIFPMSGKSPEDESRKLIFNLGVATIPIVIAGLLFSNMVENNLRNIWVIVIASLFFGLILGAVWLTRSESTREKVTLGDALFIGCAQCLAIVPGVSRSGITITAGLYLGLNLASAVRFSFLLAIPAILGAVTLGIKALIEETTNSSYSELLLSMFVSGLSGYFAIAAFFGIIDRVGLMPFIIYRVLLSLGLMTWMLSS